MVHKIDGFLCVGGRKVSALTSGVDGGVIHCVEGIWESVGMGQHEVLAFRLI